MSNDQLDIILFNNYKSQDELGDEFYATLLDQYKLYLEMADRISSRRSTANSFFLSVNIALISLVSYAHYSVSDKIKLDFIIPVAGIILCYCWYRIIRSYKDLNSAKFKIIHRIEKKLSISPYDAEWEAVERGENKNLYLPFTHIEIIIPWLFFAIHILVLFIIVFQMCIANIGEGRACSALL